MDQAKKATKEVAESGHGSFEKLGGKMQDVGLTLSHSVTLPLIAIGGIAVKLSSDFEGAFGRMQGLAGVTAGEVDGLKESVLKLSGETAQGPQDLADGLYFLRSSGLSASDAMDALKVSARASAAGLGSTAVIADAVSSAMNAYAKSGLSAAEATDILTGTARAGKAEPAELAGALGRVLPIASELGVTFKDVGGAIASLSLTGNDASTSATLLTNILSKMLKPSQQGAEALAGVGMSATSIRESIADKGLLGTLDDLKTRLGDAGFVKFLEDAQAVQGALSLTGQNAEGVRATFDNVANSVGATDQAFAAVAQTSGFKMKQAWADTQVALIQAGDVIIPIVSGVAGAFGHLAQIFSGLPGPVQTIVIGLLGLVAAAGPLLIVGGTLVKNFREIRTTFEGMAGAATTASLALGAVGLVMIAATAWYADNARKKAELVAITNSFAQALEDEAAGQKGAVDASIAAQLNNPKLIEQAKVLGLTVSDMARIIRGEAVPAYAHWQEMAKDNTWSTLGSDMNDVVYAFGTVNNALAPLNDGLALAKENAVQLAANERELSAASTETDRETRKLNATFIDGSQAFEATQQAAEVAAYAVNRFAEEAANADIAYRRLTGQLDEQEAWDNVNAAITKFGENTNATAEDVRGVSRAIAEYVVHTNTIPAEKKTEILAALRDGDIAEAERQLAALTVTREIYLKLTGPGAVTAAGYGPLSGSRAEGGPVLGGGRYLVGERGPEVVEMRGPGWVYPNNQYPMTAAAAGGWAGGAAASSSVVNNNTISFGDIKNTIDMKAAWQQANFALISAAA